MTKTHHKTIGHGRKSITFGMPWFAVSEGESPAKAAAAFARESKDRFDLVVSRKDAAPQFGVAATLEGAKAGAISAAAIVADLVPTDSWIYVLEIEASIWICAGRDGFILPEGDQVFDNRDAARQAYDRLGPSSFKKVYLPETWKGLGLGGVRGDVETTSLSNFVEFSGPKWGRLTSLSPAAGLLRKAAVLLLLGGIGAAGYHFILAEPSTPDIPQWTPDDLARLMAEQQADQDAELRRQQELDRLRGARPWHQIAASDQVFDTCLDALRSMPSNPVGYKVTSVHCDGANVDAAVERTSGYSTWLQEWVNAYPDLVVTVSTNGDSGFISRALGGLPPRGAQEIMPFPTLSRDLMTTAQIEGSRVDLATPSAQVIAEEPDLVPYFATSTYSISTLRPEAWREFFRTTPGLVLTAFSYSIEDSTYTLEGEIYVPNQ